MTLRNFLYIFFKDRPLIFTFFLAGIVFSLLYCFAAPPIYKGEAHLLVFAPSPRLSPIEQYRPEAYRAEDRSRLIGDQIELLKGQQVTEEVVATLARKGVHPPVDGSFLRRITDTIEERTGRLLFRLNLVPAPQEPERRTTARFLDALRVEPVRGTNLVSIAFHSIDPVFAAAAANAYAEEYVARHNRVQESQETYRSYSDQAEVLANKLSQTEERLQQFTSDVEASDGSSRKDLLARSVADLTKKYERASLDAARAQGWIARLRQARNHEAWIETPASGLTLAGRQSYLKSLDDSYFALKGERERLARLYSADATEVRAIDSHMANLRALKIGSLLAAASVDLSLANERKATLARRVEAEEKRLEDLGAALATREELERDKEAIEKEYRSYMEKADELRGAAELEAQASAHLRIASPAVPPLGPVSMRKELIVLYSAIAGLIVGFLFSMVRQSLRHIFRGASDVAGNLSAPLLLTVPFTEASPVGTTGVEGKKNGVENKEKGLGRLRKIFGVDLRRPVAVPGALMFGGAAVVVIILSIAIGASGHLQHLRGSASRLPQGMRADLEAVSRARLTERKEGPCPSRKSLRGSGVNWRCAMQAGQPKGSGRAKGAFDNGVSHEG